MNNMIYTCLPKLYLLSLECNLHSEALYLKRSDQVKLNCLTTVTTNLISSTSLT